MSDPLKDLIDALHWGDGGGAYPATDPGDPFKDVGLEPNAIPPSEEWNWWYNAYWQTFEGLYDRGTPLYDDLADALEERTLGQTFTVRPPATDNATGLGGVRLIDSDITVNLGIHSAYDGRHVYVAEAAQVDAFQARTGASAWAVEPTGADIVGLAADGAFVWSVTADDEVALQNVLTGALLDSAATSVTLLGQGTANGLNAAWSEDGDAHVYLYNWDGVNVSELGNYDHGGAGTYVVLACDDRHVYIGGGAGTGNFQIRAIRWSDQLAEWSFEFPTTAFPTVNGLATDGEILYVAASPQTLASPYEGTANLWALNAKTGALLHWANVGGGSTLYGIAIDDRYLVLQVGVAPGTMILVAREALNFAGGPEYSGSGTDHVGASLVELYDLAESSAGTPFASVFSNTPCDGRSILVKRVSGSDHIYQRIAYRHETLDYYVHDPEDVKRRAHMAALRTR